MGEFISDYLGKCFPRSSLRAACAVWGPLLNESQKQRLRGEWCSRVSPFVWLWARRRRVREPAWRPPIVSGSFLFICGGWLRPRNTCEFPAGCSLVSAGRYRTLVWITWELIKLPSSRPHPQKYWVSKSGPGFRNLNPIWGVHTHPCTPNYSKCCGDCTNSSLTVTMAGWGPVAQTCNRWWQIPTEAQRAGMAQGSTAVGIWEYYGLDLDTKEFYNGF